MRFHWGMPHDHPFWKECDSCAAWPEYKQILAMLLWLAVIVGSPLWLIYIILEAVVKP
ncbi:MAG TPA: hypothetical protein VIR02_09525 [Anaerolineales bacterium]|jgi:hypothetical protein